MVDERIRMERGGSMRRLRIFYAADDHPNVSIPGSRIWYANLYLTLVELGHEVVRFDYDLSPFYRYWDMRNPEHRAFIETNRPMVQQALLEQIGAAHREKPIDLFFSYLFTPSAVPETIRSIREMGILTVNWYCNASYQFDLIADLAPAFDYCLVPEKFRLEDYRRIGARPIYCQEAANPAIYRPYDLPQEFDVTFVGAAYGDRPAFVRYLLDHGIDVRVWGPQWHRFAESRYRAASPLRRSLRQVRRTIRNLLRRPHAEFPQLKEGVTLPDAVIGDPLTDEELVRMYSRSRINLGFSTCGATHQGSERIRQIRLRDFEVPMSGGFYLVEYMEELEEFFEIGKEIVCYHDPDDLVDKIRYYLAHDEERERIRRAGRERCLRDHTWRRRFLDVFEQIGLTA